MYGDIDQCSIAFRGGERVARVKPTPARPIYCCMEFRHRCSFCGWTRPAPSSVMLAPNCESCGCVLDSARAAPAPGQERRAPSLPPLATFVLVRAAIVLALLTLYAAARLGYDAGGAPGAITGVGLAGFLLLPCVPKTIA
jgi:hypothetical protein